MLILLALGVFWGDARFDRMVLPEGLRPLFFGRETPPPGVLFFLLAMVVSLLAAWELARILRQNGVLASNRITCLAAGAGLAVSCLVPSTVEPEQATAIVSSGAVLVLLSALAFYSRQRTFEGVVAAAGGALLSFVYLGLMFGFYLALRREYQVGLLVWLLLTTKSCDIGAYFTGRAFGRHKLILWLSPGKTWEGFFGGVALAAAVGGVGTWAMARWGGIEVLTVTNGAMAGAVFGVVGQGGDLIASLFKRDAGIKDSSKVLPGFGGALDVLDSLLLVAPVAYWWVSVFARPGSGMV